MMPARHPSLAALSILAAFGLACGFGNRYPDDDDPADDVITHDTHDTDDTDHGDDVIGCEGASLPCSDLSESPLILTGVDTGVDIGAFGYLTAGGADFDGDGLDDVVAGCPAGADATGGDGYAALVLGGREGRVPWDRADLLVTGLKSDLWPRIGFLPDQDSDGRAELWVAANGLSEGWGVVFLFSGGTLGDVGLDDADATIVHESGGDGLDLWMTVAGSSDLTGDAVPDLLIGAPLAHDYGSSSGIVYLFAGPLSGSLTVDEAVGGWQSAEGYEVLGLELSSVGDLDGDGVRDALVSAAVDEWGGTLAGLVYLGPVTGWGSAEDADVQIGGAENVDVGGARPANSVDLNGDGYDDLALGIVMGWRDDSEFGVAVVYGPPRSQSVAMAPAQIVQMGYGYLFGSGRQISGLRDVDGDGADELVVSNMSDDAGAGAAYLFMGPVFGVLDSSDADRVYLSGVADDRVGASVADAGDVDGDGWGDLIIGARGDGRTVPGHAYVLPAVPIE